MGKSMVVRTGLLAASVVAAFLTSACSSSGIGDALDVSNTSPQTTGSIAQKLASARPADGVGTDALQEESALPAENAITEQSAEPIQVAMVRPEPAPAASKPRNSGSYSKFKVYPPRFRDAKPVSFGKVDPDHYAVHGVDVSRWQGTINWPKLRKQGANFAYIKATEGGDYLDPEFRTNWKNAEAAGIPRGAYHFFYWCRVAEEQADWFIRNVPKERGALPPVIDVEWNNESRSCRKRPSREVVLKKMKVFMDKLERHYGQRPIIYTAPDFYADNLKGQFRNHSFWLRSVAAHPKERYPGRDFAFWQYSGTGLSAHHETQIDLNVFNGTEASFRRWLKERVY